MVARASLAAVRPASMASSILVKSKNLMCPTEGRIKRSGGSLNRNLVVATSSYCNCGD